MRDLTVFAARPAVRTRPNGHDMRADEVRYAGVGRRSAAYLLDGILVGLVIFVVALGLLAILGPTLRIDRSGDVPAVIVDPGRVAVNSVAGLLVGLLYFVGSWTRRMATPGQRLLGIEVRSTEGSSLDVGPSLVRWALLGGPIALTSLVVQGIPGGGFWLGGAAAGWFALLWITTALNRRRMGLHDRIVGSMVVRRDGGATA